MAYLGIAFTAVVNALGGQSDSSQSSQSFSAQLMATRGGVVLLVLFGLAHRRDRNRIHRARLHACLQEAPRSAAGPGRQGHRHVRRRRLRRQGHRHRRDRRALRRRRASPTTPRRPASWKPRSTHSPACRSGRSSSGSTASDWIIYALFCFAAATAARRIGPPTTATRWIARRRHRRRDRCARPSTDATWSGSRWAATRSGRCSRRRRVERDPRRRDRRPDPEDAELRGLGLRASTTTTRRTPTPTSRPASRIRAGTRSPRKARCASRGCSRRLDLKAAKAGFTPAELALLNDHAKRDWRPAIAASPVPGALHRRARERVLAVRARGGRGIPHLEGDVDRHREGRPRDEHRAAEGLRRAARAGCPRGLETAAESPARVRTPLPGLRMPRGSSAALMSRCIASTRSPSSARAPGASAAPRRARR